MALQWSEEFRWREKVREKYHSHWDLRTVRKRLPFVLSYLKDGESVLEVGANNRTLEGRIRHYRPGILYKSLDIDPAYPHDYSSFEEIRETFDVVLLFEVIEHLDLRSGIELVAKIHHVLKPGGRVILTTPNIYTPGQYWIDVTHLTPYHYAGLGGLFVGSRFEVLEICRLFNGSLSRYLVKAYLFSPLFRFLGIDFTKSIILAARRP